MQTSMKIHCSWWPGLINWKEVSIVFSASLSAEIQVTREMLQHVKNFWGEREHAHFVSVSKVRHTWRRSQLDNFTGKLHISHIYICHIICCTQEASDLRNLLIHHWNFKRASDFWGCDSYLWFYVSHILFCLVVCFGRSTSADFFPLCIWAGMFQFHWRQSRAKSHTGPFNHIKSKWIYKDFGWARSVCTDRSQDLSQ